MSKPRRAECIMCYRTDVPVRKDNTLYTHYNNGCHCSGSDGEVYDKSTIVNEDGTLAYPPVEPVPVADPLSQFTITTAERCVGVIHQRCQWRMLLAEPRLDELIEFAQLHLKRCSR